MLYVGKSSTNGSPYIEVPEGTGHEIVIVANRQLQTHSHWFPFTKGISNPGGERPVHLEWWRGSAATLPGRYCTFPTPCSQHSWSFLDTASSLRRQNGSTTSLSLGYPSEKKSGTTMWIQKWIQKWLVGPWSVDGKSGEKVSQRACHEDESTADLGLFTPLRVGWPPTPQVISVRTR